MFHRCAAAFLLYASTTVKQKISPASVAILPLNSGPAAEVLREITPSHFLFLWLLISAMILFTDSP